MNADWNPDEALRLVRLRLAQGDSQGAIRLLRRVLSQDPDEADAHGLLAHALLAQKRIHAARHEADLALTLDPENPDSHLAVAQALIAHRDLRRAEEHAEKARELAPLSPIPVTALARIRLLRGDRAGARARLEEALAMDPENVDVVTFLGQLDLIERRYDAAHARALEALRMEAEHGDALCLMGGVLLAKGDVEGARDHAIQALRGGEQADALRLLAAIKARQSPLLGLWWRYSVWIGSLGDGRATAVLVGVYIVYRFLTVYLSQGDHRMSASIVSYAWMGMCVYTWVGPGIFRRSVERELGNVQLREGF